ncbi:MAG: hypothetical protein SFZ24_07460 [Planctomycetota bacterium]|nr:hypothetical protein [Planctomycetota bacterium]
MRLKGISPFEQHAEKMVLGVVALAGVGALVLQFLPGGNLIKVGNEQVTPGQAFAPVAREAQTLQARVNSDAPALPQAPSFTLADKLNLAGASLPPAPQVALGIAPRIGAGSLSGALASGLYEVPAVPAPAKPQAVAYSATVHPAERLLTPELATVLPEKQPFDLSAVSIEFTFDGSALRAALEADPDETGPKEPVPLSWWRDSAGAGDQVVVLGVDVERQMVRDADGRSVPETTPPEPVPPMPGRFQGLKAWTEGVRSVGDVPSALDLARFNAPDIERPKFYTTIAGPEWRPPSTVIAAGDPLEKQAQVRRIRQTEADVRRRIANAEARLQQAGGGGDDSRRETRPREGGGGGGKGGSGGPRNTAPTPSPDRANAERQQLERTIESLRRRLDDVARQLIALGEPVDGYDALAPQDESGALPEEPTPLLENAELKLWAHDVNPQVGATYRYRARVVVNNPLFDRNLQEEQKQLGAASTLRGAWSEWSEPVTADPKRVLFMVSAEDRSAISPRPRATAEVYEFYYGFYRKATVGLEPGDIVAGTAKLPELRAADMTKLQESMTAGQPGMPPGAGAPPPPPPGRRGLDPGVRAPRGPDGMPTPGRQPNTGQPGATGTSTPEIVWPAWMTQVLPNTLEFQVDAQLLDVLSVPLDNRQRTHVVLRRSDGTLATRVPDLERASDLLKRLEASEKAGQTQGQEPDRLEAPGPSPIIPPRRREEDRGRAPGGGGGGGG